jgi:hypothetical protein
MLKAGDASKIETKSATTGKKRKFNGRKTRTVTYVQLCLMDGKGGRKK